MNKNHTSKCETWLKTNGKRKIQSFQDSCADMFNISLGIIALDGESLTVWSNSSLFCHRVIKKNSERCNYEKQRIIDYVRKKGTTIMYTCYMGITYFACPIFCGDELVAVCLGGGIHMKGNNLMDESDQALADKIAYDVPVLSETKLNDIIKMLENVFNLLVLNESADLKEDNKQGDVKQDLFFLQKKLSLRELEVVKLINSGLSNKEISANLNISEKTVKTHITNILRKLNMKDRLEIIIYCKNVVS